MSFTFIYGTAGILRAGGFLTSPWAVVLAEVTFYTPFALTGRGQAFTAAAEAVVLLVATVVLVVSLDRLRGRAAER